MDSALILPMCVGGGVIALIGTIGLLFSKTNGSQAEERLDGITGKLRPKNDPNAGILLRPSAIDLGAPGFWTRFLPNADSVNLLYEQAAINISFNRFVAIIAGLTVIGGLATFLLHLPIYLVPVSALFFGSLPILWLFHRKRSRVKTFLAMMPEAVELISRALRAGHGLASGLRMVAEEMKGPIAEEFGRVFEEQNLGIPIELSLRGMADRIPSMDVRFFVIAVLIQRATGGDLAEVLDKIGRLIRQRFELQGHVRALTAEGRLSGIVLLALPPGLLAFLTFSNYGYISPLFTTPIGTKMLLITAGLQLMGALMIKKIVAIKV